MTVGATGLNNPLACTVAGSRLYISNYGGNNAFVCPLNATGFVTSCSFAVTGFGSPVGIAVRL